MNERKIFPEQWEHPTFDKEGSSKPWTNAAFSKEDTFTAKDKMGKRYQFQQDCDFSMLPKKETITQPRGYKGKAAQKLLKYADYSHKLPRENFFSILNAYYAHGLQQNDPIPDFGNTGFAGLDKIYQELYDNQPFHHIVGKPEANFESGKQGKIEDFQQRHLDYQEFASQFGHKPYRYAHYPFLETIGKETPGEHDTMLYKSDVSYEQIIKHFRAAERPAGSVPFQRLKKFVPSQSEKLLNSVKKYYKK